MNGTITVARGAQVTIHTYTSPPDGWLVNTQIPEGPTRLVLFDGQLVNAYAEEVATYASRLHKPVERLIVSHDHPDHWAGLAVLTARFPQAAVHALPGVTDLIRAAGDAMLGGLQQTLGDTVATHVTVPSHALFVGVQTIDGTRLEIKEYHDAESNVPLVALLPDQKIMLASDLVFAPHDHVFTLAPHFDHWIGILEELKATAGYDTIVIGHDAPTDRSAYDAPITYLRRARGIYAGVIDGKTYADGLKAAFPKRRQPRWVDFSGLMLYAAQPEPVT
jgi:glyoxylase-like metal-dependent hydrolase (beta-lactamase superfamily II)